jgi:hypothetical protein
MLHGEIHNSLQNAARSLDEDSDAGEFWSVELPTGRIRLCDLLPGQAAS